MIDSCLRDYTLRSRIDKDINKILSYQDKEFSYDTLLAHVDAMHSLIHKAKEGLTGSSFYTYQQGMDALKFINAMQSYITWDE